MNWQDIKTFPNIHYSVNIPWWHLEETLDRYKTEGTHGLNMNPDFQRGHVWTEAQQIAYVEFMLREPQSGRDIYFNHPGWMSTFEGEFVLVDGKQRIEAALKFLHDEIPAFNHKCSEFGGYKHLPLDVCFIFNIAKLKSRADVLQWYLDFNAGGTPHAKSEIDRVRQLLEAELNS
jgi:hypothetical protein